MGISLDVSNSWKSYKSADIKSNVSSLINDVKEDFSNGINNAKQSWNNASTMVVDLSQKVEEKFDANWDTVKSSFSSAASTLGEQVNNLKTGAQNLRETFNTALNNAKKKTDEFTNNLETKLISASEWVADKENWKKVGATITVGATSVLTGIADLGEKLFDGVTWCGAKIVEGGSFVVAKIQEKTGHEDAAKKTMDWRENMKTDVADLIATDYVQDFNKYIYEETKLGQAINADSWLKYDSKVAQGISSVTEKVAEFAAATAVTVATGGAAAPAAFATVFGTGFLAGVGGSAEKNYAAAKANGKEVSIDDKNLNIFIDGVGSGFSWYAQGKLGQGMVQAAKAISKVGAKTFGSTMLNGFKETLSSLKGKSAKEVISTIFTKSNLKTQLFSADNLSDSGGVVADNVASWINGDEDFNLKSVLGAGAELLGTSLMNIITGGIVDNVSKIDDAVGGADDILKNSEDVIDSVNGVSKSADIKKLQQEYDELVAYTNSEKGGFDAVYGRGADKARYNDSVARIREIEDILKNADDVSTTSINSIDSSIRNSSTGVTNSNNSFYQKPQYSAEIFRRQKLQDDLDVCCDILDNWGAKNNVSDYAEKALRQYAETGSAYQLINGKWKPYITSDGNVRAYIESLDPNDVKRYLDSNILKSGDNVEMYSFFKNSGSPTESNYGASQNGIKDLCEYSLNGKKYDSNGKKYTYDYVMKLINDAKMNGDVIPNFKKEATPEYFDLKNKLISQGFENGKASVILSSVDDVGACSYAAKANAIFYQFSNNPDLFEEVFGFPMYKTINGVKTLNSNELILDLYVYANDTANGGNLFTKIGNSYNFNCGSKIDVFGRNMLNTGQQVCLSLGTGSNKSILDNYFKSKGLNYITDNIKRNWGQPISNNEWSSIMQSVDEAIEKGNSVSINIFDRKPPKEIRLISTNPNSYISDSTLRYQGGGHAIMITGKTQDGFLISSYGQEYKIPFSDLQNGGYFNIMVDKIRML